MRKPVLGSFRDPSGTVYFEDGVLYRQVNLCYKENYDYFYSCGLYDKLVSFGLLLPHIEVKNGGEYPIYKVIKPELIKFISYPYEWCFSQIKDAALVTLKIQKLALDYGMTIKDASAYNIQFVKGKPVLIDILSFKKYQIGKPWNAYKQFCQHFLAPLVLISYIDPRLKKLSRVFLDGIPIDLCKRVLPFYRYINPGLFLHIYLQAKFQTRYADGIGEKAAVRGKFSLNSFKGLIESLESLINKLRWIPRDSNWIGYYSDSESYNLDAIHHKEKVVKEFLEKADPKNVWDFGANIGLFSGVASNKGINTISFDADPACVELNYVNTVKQKEINILPLVLDLTNPSPNIGWENEERMSLLARGPVELVMALALIHHLAISNNLPFDKIASFFSKVCKWLIIEFVPKEDEMVKRMLAIRDDIFGDYSQEYFEREFIKYFAIVESVKINNSKRILYLMKKRGAV